jgi:hypothetical protein
VTRCRPSPRQLLLNFKNSIRNQCAALVWPGLLSILKKAYHDENQSKVTEPAHEYFTPAPTH